jgi:Cof subfamily protein (haloacid dehalogenase superfamily)
MDGTLLNDEHELHEHFWPMIKELHARGILFCPASGRQYYNLLDHFAEIADDVVFIAENGTYVVHHGREVSSDCLSRSDAVRLIQSLRETINSGVDAGVVVCGKRSAYIERTDARFLAEVTRYFTRLEVVGDLLDAVDEEEVLELSIFDFGSPEVTTAPALADFHVSHLVTVSSAHWVDVTSRTANKGAAIRALQKAFGISPDETMVFGDFLNDLEMMDAATYSFAMENAHPLLRARARYVAPSNRDNGVVRTVGAVLGISFPESDVGSG